MKKATFARLAVRAALFYFTLGGICQSIEAQSEIRFRLVHNTLIVVSLMAGREGPFDFVLDTGADTSIVDPSIAAKLSLLPLDQTDQTTLAGVQTLRRGSIPILSIGPAQAKNVTVLVQDLSEIHKLDPQLEGIAGQNFLSHFNYLIDYRKHALRIEQAVEIQQSLEGDRVAIEAVENRMLINSEGQSRKRAKVLLLLDSGANSLLLLHSASQALDISSQQSGLETTSAGQVGLAVGRVKMLRVGSQEFHDIPVALPAIGPAEHIGDGLLPMALFQAVYVNNRDGFVIFNPRVRKS
jgi:predicted aspartyl protease